VRREEAAQAAVTNIQIESGIHYLQTDEDETLQQNLKNEDSKRRVPIHSSLIALGLLQYVEDVKTAGHARLFPDLKKGSNGYGDAVGKWWSRHVDSLGLTDPRLVFHSLRHGALSKLRIAKCSSPVEYALLGHAEGDVHGASYGHRELLPISLLKEGLEWLRYDSIVDALSPIQQQHHSNSSRGMG